MEQPEITQDSAVETTATESHAEADTPEHENESTEADTQEGTPADEEEVEYEGEKYKLPAKLKEALLRQSDYTRKTQEVAEQRKAIESQRAEIQQQAQLHQAFLDEVAEVKALDRTLSQYEKLDWQQIIDSDPVQAMKLDREMRELQAQREQKAYGVTQKQQQQALAEQQRLAKQAQEASLYLAREIPGWSDERSNQLLKYGTDAGVPAAELSRFAIQYPAIGKLIHKAEMYDQLAKKQAIKPTPAAQEKPVTRIAASKSGTVKDPDKMSVEEWTKWRNAQVRNR